MKGVVALEKCGPELSRSKTRVKLYRATDYRHVHHSVDETRVMEKRHHDCDSETQGWN